MPSFWEHVHDDGPYDDKDAPNPDGNPAAELGGDSLGQKDTRNTRKEEGRREDPKPETGGGIEEGIPSGQ